MHDDLSLLDRGSAAVQWNLDLTAAAVLLLAHASFSGYWSQFREVEDGAVGVGVALEVVGVAWEVVVVGVIVAAVGVASSSATVRPSQGAVVVGVVLVVGVAADLDVEHM